MGRARLPPGGARRRLAGAGAVKSGRSAVAARRAGSSAQRSSAARLVRSRLATVPPAAGPDDYIGPPLAHAPSHRRHRSTRPALADPAGGDRMGSSVAAPVRFFIVGAPKCGTTAMADYLAQHPEIGMCAIKETQQFGSRSGAGPLLAAGRRFSDEQYLALFDGREGQSRRGGLGLDLYSPRRTINAYSPGIESSSCSATRSRWCRRCTPSSCSWGSSRRRTSNARSRSTKNGSGWARPRDSPRLLPGGRVLRAASRALLRGVRP